MLYAVLSAVLVLLVYLPSLWVRYVMHKYNKPLTQMPGTGGELAEHLIKRFELEDVAVEQTTEGADHYDPAAKMVRLSPSNYDGKSITAVAVAAHEVGHAIQFARNETISQLRSRYIPKAMLMKKIGILLLTLLPIAGFVIKAPALLFGLIGLSIGLQLFGALAYLIVLPEEWDASFNKALPILKEGDYLPEDYQPGAHRVLKAAALTYFAGALADVVNIGRWLLVLRR
ncbi:MAG: zinc metallopeptidase [Pseudomonadales bacterium]